MFWFTAYGLFNFLAGKPILPHGTGVVAGILSGPWIGLWYIPFGIVFIFLSATALSITSRVDRRQASIVWITLGFVLLAAAYEIRRAHYLSAPYAQWLHASPAIFFGLGINRARSAGWRFYFVTLAATSVTLIFFQSALLVPPDPGLLVPYATAFLLLTLTTAHAPILERIPTQTVVPLCFGAYISHGIFVPFALRLAPEDHRYIAFLLVALGAFGSTFIARRTKILRRVF